MRMYFWFFIFLHSFVVSNIVQKDAIFNGFKQFLGEVYSYESEQLIGGLSKNTQYLWTVNNKKYVVRVLGESFPKRKNEINIHSLAAANAIAPRVYYYDDAYSFIVMDYIEGHTLFLEQAKKIEVLDCIVQKVRSVTQLDAHDFLDEGGWNLCARINQDYNTIKNQQDVKLNSMIEQTFNAMNNIHQKLETQQRPLVFCHNDLNYRNIFFTEKDVIFIDWEMAGMNYEFYDLAYYSVFSCLHEADDYYLLTKYLQHIPSADELDYFKDIKLMIRCCNSFYVLAFLEHIPTSIPMESIKTFEFYAHVLCRDAALFSSCEFLYAIAVSQLQQFLSEYRA